jgi:hypothetical protein
MNNKTIKNKNKKGMVVHICGVSHKGDISVWLPGLLLKMVI